MHLPFTDVTYSPYVSSNDSCFLFFVADVKCGLYEINKKQQSKCYTWTESVQKMSRDRTEAMLDRRGPGPGPGPCTNTEDMCKIVINDVAELCT